MNADGRRDDVNERSGNHRLMQLATQAAVVVALLLVAIKVGAWWYTGSVALLSSLIDSVLDGGASLINLLAVRHALQPADREHRFGHGKAEPLAGLGQSTFVAGSGLLLLIESARRMADPQPVGNHEVGIAVMVVSMLLTLGLVRFQKRVVSRTGSVAITADSLHYTGDLLTNASVIVALLTSKFLGWLWVDPLFGLGISGYLLLNAWTIATQSLNLLMDREFADEDRRRIRAICVSHPQVRSMHDLRTRSSGPQSFIQLHLELDGDLPLRKAHAIADEVESAILAAFPNAEVIIHQDPAGIEEPRPTFH